jgi:hypothetical protein
MTRVLPAEGQRVSALLRSAADGRSNDGSDCCDLRNLQVLGPDLWRMLHLFLMLRFGAHAGAGGWQGGRQIDA